MAHTLLIANWKSHKTLDEAVQWVDDVGSVRHTAHTLVLCPPFPFLVPLGQRIKEKKYAIALGTQDLSPFPAGSYTGAVSVRNLKDLGVTYAIVGHSERRRYFHETIQEVANKVAMATEENITPILCVEKETIWKQAGALESGLNKQCVVAFEPADHIGSGEPEKLDVVLRIAKEIHEAFGEDVPVLYGGSIDEKSSKDFLAQPEIGGLLVGGASLDAKQFLKL